VLPYLRAGVFVTVLTLAQLQYWCWQGSMQPAAALGLPVRRHMHVGRWCSEADSAALCATIACLQLMPSIALACNWCSDRQHAQEDKPSALAAVVLGDEAHGDGLVSRCHHFSFAGDSVVELKVSLVLIPLRLFGTLSSFRAAAQQPVLPLGPVVECNQCLICGLVLPSVPA